MMSGSASATRISATSFFTSMHFFTFSTVSLTFCSSSNSVLSFDKSGNLIIDSYSSLVPEYNSTMSFLVYAGFDMPHEESMS